MSEKTDIHFVAVKDGGLLGDCIHAVVPLDQAKALIEGRARIVSETFLDEIREMQIVEIQTVFEQHDIPIK